MPSCPDGAEVLDLRLQSSSPAGAAGCSPAARVVLGAIRGYQLFVRPLLTGSCRYLPTCSDYAMDAVHRYGAIRGGWLGLKRLLRCHPFGGSGLDPVP